MEDNIYSVIQEWHTLYEGNIITSDEFNEKKQELLGTRILAENKKKTSKILPLSIISLTIICAVSFYFYNINSVEERNLIENQTDHIRPAYDYEKNEDPYTLNGIYTVDSLNVRRTYFHDTTDVSSKRNAYLTPNDQFYILKVRKNFGYVEFENNQGNTTSGWLKIDDIIQCDYCE